MDLYRHQDSGLFVRNKGHEGIIKEQREWSSLRGVGAILKNTLALDLGGHIGCFPWWAFAHLGLRKVVSVEPDPANIEVYRANWSGADRTELIEAAVAEKGGEEISLYLGRTYSASNSVYPFRGRQEIRVKTVAFQQLLKKYKPTLIKCDIEGAEYGLDWRALPSHVRAVCMELHQHRPEWCQQQLDLVALIVSQGFKPLRDPRPPITFTRCSIGVWSR